MWRDEGYIFDMIRASRFSISFCCDLTFEQFDSSVKDQSSVLYQIGVLGEAARNISDEFKESHSEIPWKEIRGIRNRVIHEYRHVIIRELWNVVQRDLPDLIVKLEAALPKEPGK